MDAASFTLVRLLSGSLMLWLIIEPAFGPRMAWMTLFSIAAVTIIGFEFSERFLPFAGVGLIAGIQGLIIGTIIHSLIHRGHVHSHHGETQENHPEEH